MCYNVGGVFEIMSGFEVLLMKNVLVVLGGDKLIILVNVYLIKG